uniref:Uncharacterized protein n=1 Tax=Plectus sambesii TaxID=2011161 RepID=A0A914XI80_9BILA
MVVPQVNNGESIGGVPIAPHIPIRQRLSISTSRRNSSVDVDSTSSVFGRTGRRMSLLQTLREQNRQRSRRQSDESDQEPASENNRRSTMTSSPQRQHEQKSRKISAPHLTNPKVVLSTRKSETSPRTRPDRLPVSRYLSADMKRIDQEIRIEHDTRPNWSCGNLIRPKNHAAKSELSDSMTDSSVTKDQLKAAASLAKMKSASLPNLCDPPGSFTDHSLSFSSPTSHKSSINQISSLSPALSPRFISSPPETEETYKLYDLKKTLQRLHQQDPNNNRHPQLSFED